MPDQKIIEKIKKLLELTSSANKEDHERKLAMERAQELMIKHSIDEQILADDKGETLEIIEEEYTNPAFLKQGVVPALSGILAVIPPIFGVYGVIVRSHRKEVTAFKLVGFRTNIDVAKYALDSILAQGIAKARLEYKKFRTITFGFSFWSGYTLGLTEKFGSSLEKSKDIVIYDRVRAALPKDTFSGTLTDGVAFNTGHQAGLEAELRKPIESTNSGKLLN